MINIFGKKQGGQLTFVNMKLLIILLVAIASVESDLAQDFQERVESFILTNLQSDNCDIWIDILRLEYGVEEYFCQESFTNAVSVKNPRIVALTLRLFLG